MTNKNPKLCEVSELECVVEHTIQSTPERAFGAYTEPDLTPPWWAQPVQTLCVDGMDVRPGGTWRFAYVLGEGKERVMHGGYREVDPATRLSYAFNQGEGNDGEILAIVDLKAVGAEAHITLTDRCASREQCGARVSYGAAAGAKAAWDRLAEVLRDG